MRLKLEKTSLAASVLGHSDDLLPQILIHLPAITLIRFKSVSKQWMSLISDKQFAIKHSRIQSRVPCGAFIYPTYSRNRTVSLPLFENLSGNVPPLDSIPFWDEFRPRTVDWYADIQFCNGLLLCSFHRSHSHLGVVVCKPTTRDFKLLPMPLHMGIHEYFDGLTLVFNPSVSHHYKVVCITGAVPRSQELHIYSSETKRWEFYRFMNGLEFRISPKGVFSNGMVYWIGERYTYYYNVNSQEFGSLPMRLGVSLCGYYYFAESCGRLYLADDACEVVEFDSSVKKWSKESQVKVEISLPENAFLLAVAKGENVRDFVILYHTNTTIITFDPILRRRVHAFALPSAREIYNIFHHLLRFEFL